MTNTDEKQSTILKALADENRIRLLRVLSREVLNVQELCEILGLPQSRASRHLSILRSTGLVHDQREGSRVYYNMAKLDGEFSLISGYLDGISQQDHPDLERMKGVLARRTHESQSFSEEQAGRWDQLGAELHSPTAAILALSQVMRSDRITADLGTGTGMLLPLLSGCSGKVYAVDHSSEMLALAEKRCLDQHIDNVQFICGDLTSLDKQLPELCDSMLMHFVLHQLASPQHILECVAKGLKPGGRLVIVDRTKHDDERVREKFGSLWLGFEQKAVEGWFIQAGFTDIAYHELQPDTTEGPQGIFVAAATR